MSNAALAALDLLLRLGTAVWWIGATILTAAVVYVAGFTTWAAWRGVVAIRRRRVRKAARHRLYVRRILRTETERATCERLWNLPAHGHAGKEGR
jgi:hypothetical protein